ncbi:MULTISPECIES: DUF1080 domain-containing protein [Paracoccus]|uniref:3-keto-disaccharide hydrolase n=1 Tax=Paracoccus TaxID=265 RepID=UPI00086BBEBF|nr:MULTISPECIES: DUF1080 domain-containing protein [Paracoccus]ODT60781.1 MAG: large, multifunctional secreted protein [Paracoccus sp. SCN 68-21]
MKTMTTLAALMALTAPALAQDADVTPEERRAQSEVTEVWEPVPETVQTPEGQPPSDAIVLFDGTGLDGWESVNGGPAEWTVEDGAMRVGRGTGDIRTTDSFCDVQLHVEWRSPPNDESHDGQDRGNSGIFLQSRYEVQVLDSHENPTYPNGQAGSIYKQHLPLVNASRAPGEWQSYDIIFQAPVFAEGGALRRPAHITVLHNGVVVQNHAQIQGATEWIGYPAYEAHDCAPIQLQDHDADVAFRNIWVRPM